MDTHTVSIHQQLVANSKMQLNSAIHKSLPGHHYARSCKLECIGGYGVPYPWGTKLVVMFSRSECWYLLTAKIVVIFQIDSLGVYSSSDLNETAILEQSKAPSPQIAFTKDEKLTNFKTV